MSEKHQVIIDTDPGIDDLAALTFALHHPNLEVLGLTICYGNVPLEHCTRNARHILSLCKKGSLIPVVPGAAKPLLREPRFAAYVHGNNGLGDVEIPESEPQSHQFKRAVDFIIETVLASPPKTVSIIALGPPTNVALALSVEPKLIPHLKSVIMMGGAVRESGNVTPCATANFVGDPEATSIVYKSGVRVVQAGMDVCRKVAWGESELAQIAELKSPMTQLLIKASECIKRFYLASGQLTHGVLQWNDVPAVVYAAVPEIFETKDAYVEIETHSETTIGMTIADFRRQKGKDSNTTILMNINVAAYKQLVISTFAQAS